MPSVVGPSRAFLSAHARYAVRAAEACGYAFHSLDGADGYLFEVRDGARRAVFTAGAGSPYALNDARAAALARDKAFCAESLRRAGLAVVPGRMFFVTKRWAELRGPGREPEDALTFAENADYPLFCKPISGSKGAFAEVIADAGAFADYMGRVSREHYAILAQPYVRAAEYRVFVLEGRALFSYRKLAPALIGDGVRTLREFMGKPEFSARDAAGAALSPETVLPMGARAALDGPANRAAGGGAADLREGAPEPLARLALAAAECVGLRLAGVDMFAMAPDWSALALIEVNASPMIATLEDHGRWDLIEAIWRANFAAALR